MSYPHYFVDATPYAVQVDSSAAPLVYVGEALPGTLTSDAKWRIQLITPGASGVAITWAGGSNTFVNVWDSRASLVYS